MILTDDKLAELIAIYEDDAELVLFLRELQQHRARKEARAALAREESQ